MTEYAILVKHHGWLDRFAKQAEPPDRIDSTIWWAIDDKDILRFRRRETAEMCIRQWQLRYARDGYSFVLMHTVMVSEWQPV